MPDCPLKCVRRWVLDRNQYLWRILSKSATLPPSPSIRSANGQVKEYVELGQRIRVQFNSSAAGETPLKINILRAANLKLLTFCTITFIFNTAKSKCYPNIISIAKDFTIPRNSRRIYKWSWANLLLLSSVPWVRTWWVQVTLGIEPQQQRKRGRKSTATASCVKWQSELEVFAQISL